MDNTKRIKVGKIENQETGNGIPAEAVKDILKVLISVARRILESILDILNVFARYI